MGFPYEQTFRYRDTYLSNLMQLKSKRFNQSLHMLLLEHLKMYSFYQQQTYFSGGRNGSSFPLNAFESILKQIQKLAPELHRVSEFTYAGCCQLFICGE